MDSKLRELERQAATGDAAAEQQLKNAQSRLYKPLPEPEFRIQMEVPIDWHCYGTVVAHVPMDADNRDVEEAARAEDLPRDWEYFDGSLEVSHEEVPLLSSRKADLHKLRDVLLQLWKQNLIWPITDVPNSDIGAEQAQDAMYDEPRMTGFIHISAGGLNGFDAWAHGEQLEINYGSREGSDDANEAVGRIVCTALAVHFVCSWIPGHPIYIGTAHND